MRKIIYVPIIHMSSDMGSIATFLEKGTANFIGQEIWEKHKEVVSQFWDSIAQFFDSLNVTGYKIYQDGQVVDGEDGIKIIREGANQGSMNYKIIENLLERGAILVKTEDFALVKQEHDFIKRIAESKSARERETAILRYKLAQNKLLDQRDSFIANTILKTLAQDETGILFIGAYHNIIPKLTQDILIYEVKKRDKVIEYQNLLSNPRRDSKQFKQLAEYLISPVMINL